MQGSVLKVSEVQRVAALALTAMGENDKVAANGARALGCVARLPPYFAYKALNNKETLHTYIALNNKDTYHIIPY